MFWMLLFCLAAPAEGPQTPTNLLAESDQLYVHREDRKQLLKAIEGYETVLAQDPLNYEAAWKLSKAYWYRGNHSPPDDKKLYFEKGIEAAKKAVDLRNNQCEGHFWLGINYAMCAESSGALKALGLVDDMKKALHRAMEIDNNCQCGGPQRVLGKLYARLPWFKGGSKSKAIDYLNQSLELCPQDTQSRIFLAEIYVDEDKKNEAVKQLNFVLQQEADPEWIPEMKENRILAEKMLRQLEGK